MRVKPSLKSRVSVSLDETQRDNLEECYVESYGVIVNERQRVAFVNEGIIVCRLCSWILHVRQEDGDFSVGLEDWGILIGNFWNRAEYHLEKHYEDDGEDGGYGRCYEFHALFRNDVFLSSRQPIHQGHLIYHYREKHDDDEDHLKNSIV